MAALLTGENLARQLDELVVLQSMYEDSLEVPIQAQRAHHIPPSPSPHHFNIRGFLLRNAVGVHRISVGFRT